MKKFITPVLSLVLVFAVAGISQAASLEDEQWVRPSHVEAGYHQVFFEESVPTLDTYPHMFGTKYNNDASNSFDRYVCTTTSDPHCAQSDSIDFSSILPVCTDAAQQDCVESFKSISPLGIIDNGVFQRYTVPNHVNLFTGDPSLNIPTTQTPGIWTLPGTPNSGGNSYGVVVAVNGSINMHGNNDYTKQQINSFVVPVSLTSDGLGSSDTPASCDPKLDKGGPNHFGCQSPVPSDVTCALTTDQTGQCYARRAFPADYKFQLVARLSHEPAAWLHGRMSDPQISITPGAGKGVILTVAANPVKVPVLYYGDFYNNMPKAAKDFIVYCDGTDKVQVNCGLGSSRSTPGEYWNTPHDIRNFQLAMYGYGDESILGIKALAPLVGDKASVAPSAWSFHTLPTTVMNGANSCFTSGAGLKGIVTTNSTAYSEGPPAFRDGSLQYTVASPHFNPDSSVFKGSYNLVMRSDVARCIYKFSNAPIKASISVVTADGNNDVATTVSNETGGWLYLSANNFTFSAPTIQVKLSQDAPAKTSGSTSAATPAPGVPMKSTITCSKGKTTKTVTGVKPVCPTGYKKK